MDWERTVTDIGPRLYRYFCASFARELASELTQETLLRLVQKCDGGAFREAQGSLIMYAFGIARLVRLEAWKAVAPEDLHADSSALQTQTVKSLDDNSQAQAAELRAHISQLSEMQKQVILLYLDEDLTLKEIAELLALPVGTVKSHLHRAKEILKEKLSGIGAVYE